MSNLSLARNPNTPTETLASLATDEDPDVRCCVARNPNTPTETLASLATDEDYGVRYWVARNPNTPEDILIMIKSKDYQLNKPHLKLAH